MDEVGRHVREGSLKVGEYDALSSKVTWAGAQEDEGDVRASAAATLEDGLAAAVGARARRTQGDGAGIEKKTRGAIHRSFSIPTCRLMGTGGEAGDAEEPGPSSAASGGSDGVRAPLPDFDLVFMSYEILKKDLQPLHRQGGGG